ncbi:unnamed protein product [Ambrosiozyma monospora]|uniref:Unnamed protein product n=1 Tax=Ambrosiozyma monospora TaxID=43982 RepID=A0ACB5ST70_AMBMO|nr:unnamed protein product [Ambrosiozyma monospora]
MLLNHHVVVVKQFTLLYLNLTNFTVNKQGTLRQLFENDEQDEEELEDGITNEDKNFDGFHRQETPQQLAFSITKPI